MSRFGNAWRYLISNDQSIVKTVIKEKIVYQDRFIDRQSHVETKPRNLGSNLEPSKGLAGNWCRKTG